VPNNDRKHPATKREGVVVMGEEVEEVVRKKVASRKRSSVTHLFYGMR